MKGPPAVHFRWPPHRQIPRQQNVCSLQSLHSAKWKTEEKRVGIRYLGSKARVLHALVPLIGKPGKAGGRFIDAFSGTGVVASSAADLGWDVHINDHLRSAKVLSAARLLSVDDVPFAAFGGYGRAIDQLKAAPVVEGFMWREYSPASAEHAPRPRRYFTENNAARIDGIRSHIRKWSKVAAITQDEETLLLADLLEAASSVANTAGTFGCFLSQWSPAALRPLRLVERTLRTTAVRFTVSEGDVFSVQSEATDTVYLDPPYSKRQYAAYYHLLETLTHGDEPEVVGVSGLRPWQTKASVFSYKRRALSALLRLTKQLQATRVLISYSDDGHVDLAELAEGLRVDGAVTIHQLCSIPRYQSNGSATKSVGEFVIEFSHA